MGQQYLRIRSALELAQHVTVPIAATGRDGDNRAAFNVAMMCDREAAVDALFDVHDFEDFGHFANGDFAHNYLQVVRAAELVCRRCQCQRRGREG